jgi:transposase-like protein
MMRQRKLVMAHYDITCYVCKKRKAQMWIKSAWGDRRYICLNCESDFKKKYL